MNQTIQAPLQERLKRYLLFNYNGIDHFALILNRVDSISNPKEYIGKFLSDGMDHYCIYRLNNKYYAVKWHEGMRI